MHGGGHRVGQGVHIGQFQGADGEAEPGRAGQSEQRTGRDVAFGTVYATLERLQEKGLVRSDLGDPTPERGGRAKRYFRVTSAGLRTVRETKQSLIGLWQGLRELQGGVA